MNMWQKTKPFYNGLKSLPIESHNDKHNKQIFIAAVSQAINRVKYKDYKTHIETEGKE
ncbi:hypothetical protein [uncultured Metabacillus sp.]|uniref:hypothetical protein n=1 Tax=uncultured Metabacillus sp. TaxID=2860135 RepID=UPI00262BCBB2|nr:hypothetical protein [uncultured Metabacillus sp.]